MIYYVTAALSARFVDTRQIKPQAVSNSDTQSQIQTVLSMKPRRAVLLAFAIGAILALPGCGPEMSDYNRTPEEYKNSREVKWDDYRYCEAYTHDDCDQILSEISKTVRLDPPVSGTPTATP